MLRRGNPPPPLRLNKAFTGGAKNFGASERRTLNPPPLFQLFVRKKFEDLDNMEKYVADEMFFLHLLKLVSTYLSIMVRQVTKLFQDYYQVGYYNSHSYFSK